MLTDLGPSRNTMDSQPLARYMAMMVLMTVMGMTTVMKMDVYIKMFP